MHRKGCGGAGTGLQARLREPGTTFSRHMTGLEFLVYPWGCCAEDGLQVGENRSQRPARRLSDVRWENNAPSVA